jgi:uncharacterized protein YjbJ (UPF0337 family)
MNSLQTSSTDQTVKPQSLTVFGSPHWEEAKKEILALWTSLNGDELDRTKGNLKEIANLIHNKYGAAKKAVMKQVSDVYKKYESSPSAFAGS